MIDISQFRNPESLSRAELQVVANLPEADLDRLPFGAIQLDHSGTIQTYNVYEAQLANLERADVLGRNFFTEVAPCTNVQAFYGRFLDGVRRRDLHEVFPYRFPFKLAPRDVTITLFYSRLTDTAWVFVREVPAAQTNA